MNGGIPEKLIANVAASKAAGAALELLAESVDGNPVRYWELIRDEALKHAPLTAKQEAELTAMTATEARAFTNRIMPFGAHIDKRVRDVPLEYLDWLVGAQEDDTFRKDLRRFLLHLRKNRT